MIDIVFSLKDETEVTFIVGVFENFEMRPTVFVSVEGKLIKTLFDKNATDFVMDHSPLFLDKELI